MNHLAEQDSMFELVKQLIIDTKNPSVAHVQRRFKLGYTRANGLIQAMEGEIVTIKDTSGWRSMMKGETNGRD